MNAVPLFQGTSTDGQCFALLYIIYQTDTTTVDPAESSTKAQVKWQDLTGTEFLKRSALSLLFLCYVPSVHLTVLASLMYTGETDKISLGFNPLSCRKFAVSIWTACDGEEEQ
jgi:hypothetical protein